MQAPIKPYIELCAESLDYIFLLPRVGPVWMNGMETV